MATRRRTHMHRQTDTIIDTQTQTDTDITVRWCLSVRREMRRCLTRRLGWTMQCLQRVSKQSERATMGQCSIERDQRACVTHLPSCWGHGWAATHPHTPSANSACRKKTLLESIPSYRFTGSQGHREKRGRSRVNWAWQRRTMAARRVRSVAEISARIFGNVVKPPGVSVCAGKGHLSTPSIFTFLQSLASKHARVCCPCKKLY